MGKNPLEQENTKPQTRLFYVNTQTASSLWYLVLNDDHKPGGHQGGTLSDFWSSSQLKALDYDAWTVPDMPQGR